jgi:hypothetical protein
MIQQELAELRRSNLDSQIDHLRFLVVSPSQPETFQGRTLALFFILMSAFNKFMAQLNRGEGRAQLLSVLAQE